MSNQTTRRRFIKTSAATGIGFWVAGGLQAQESNSPNEKVMMASVGIGGKGSSDSRDAGSQGQMVAICDVDKKRLAGAASKFAGVKPYTDFRVMLDEMGDKIDAVTVSTPDHTHAPAALMAMRMGKHCFCQKPLTRTVYEARLMADVAKEMGVATQMGNQGTAATALRQAAAAVKAGHIGAPKEVHVWTNRPIWPQGGERGTPQPVPEHLDWDLWLSCAPERPYSGGYHPFSWRGWWDFGTGALGDMACHNVNLPFHACDLADPTSIQAVTPGHNRDSFPKWSVITFQFPKTETRPAIKFVWYDGGKFPPKEVMGGETPKTNGVVIVGDKDTMVTDDSNGGNWRLVSGNRPTDLEYEQSPGHFQEFIRAIKGGPAAKSNFVDAAGPLTETILLGNLAVWAANEEGEGPLVEWDAANMRVKNIEGLESIVKPTYRKGYVLDA